MTPERSPYRNADTLLAQAKHLGSAGQAPRAESLCLQLLDQHPGHAAATLMAAAQLSTTRGDLDRAATLLLGAFGRHPENTELAIQLALALAASGRLQAAVTPLRTVGVTHRRCTVGDRGRDTHC